MQILLYLLLIMSAYSHAYSGTCGNNSCQGNAPWNAISASFEDVNHCVTICASAEETINVPSGSATWNSTLVITKGINLIGAGPSNTIISASTNPCIRYAPSASTGEKNYAFRISGIKFNLGSVGGIGLCGSTKGSSMCSSSNSMGTKVAQSKVRIDNNYFLGSSTSIEVVGAFRGVVDQNVFDGFRSPQRHWGTGTGEGDWNSFGPYIYGSSDSMYYEDNKFINVGGYMVTDCAQGGRYVYRYNTISLKGDMMPLWDYHGGDKGNGVWGCFGGEIYGNRIARNNNSAYFTGTRGGKVLGFYNSLDSTEGSGNWNVYDGGTSSSPCPPASYGEYQMINNNYYFNNRRGFQGTLIGVTGGKNICGDVLNNGTYWYDTPLFDGTSGIGVGAIEKRPETCTTGVGYWATTQSISDLNEMVGAFPANPISGTLYKCSSTSTWTAYYKPYTYPHPLRNGENEYITPPKGLKLVE